MRVIRHSDDLGITRHSTGRILEAWRAGHLNGFSIIANGDATEMIPVGLSDSSELPVRLAVHFNLTEGYSSAPATEVPLLVDASGELRNTFGSLFLAALFFPLSKKRELFRQIAIECAAQIVAVRSLCGTRAIAAIDGHNHIHMIPGIFAAVARSARDAGIPEIRISFEPFYMEKPWRDWQRSFWWKNLIKHLLLIILSVNARLVARRVGLHGPDAIIGVLYSGRMTAVRALCGIKAAASATEIEIVFHVGRAHVSEASRWRRSAYASFHLSEWRDIEHAEIGQLSERMGISDLEYSIDSLRPNRCDSHINLGRN
jgi:chitin disaccharide deacetylase